MEVMSGFKALLKLYSFTLCEIKKKLRQHINTINDSVASHGYIVHPLARACCRGVNFREGSVHQSKISVISIDKYNHLPWFRLGAQIISMMLV